MMIKGTISTALLSATLLWYGVAAAQPAPEVSLNNCQNAVRAQGKLFLQNYVNAVGTCLQRVSIEIVKKNAGDASKAANTCIAQFRKIYDTRGEGKSLEEKLRAKIEQKCTPGGNNTHTLDDILGSGSPGVSEPLEVENIGNWCGQLGGSGQITSLTDWIDCVGNADTLLALTAVTVLYPRALEYLAAVKPAMNATSSPSSDSNKVSDAVGALDAFYSAIKGLDNDGRPLTRAGTQFPATGQTTSYGTGSDGDVQAGAGLRYVDNGDGTITDLNTGLMWEKKDQSGGIHDWTNQYTWGITASPYTMNGTMVSTFLAALNTVPCFAGFCDWRIPNRFELESILNLQNASPAAGTAFDTSCAASCTVDGAGGTTMCSCTQLFPYWSSTTYRVNPVDAFRVGFNGGSVDFNGKSYSQYVRAVRGGL